MEECAQYCDSVFAGINCILNLAVVSELVPNGVDYVSVVFATSSQRLNIWPFGVLDHAINMENMKQ